MFNILKRLVFRRAEFNKNNIDNQFKTNYFTNQELEGFLDEDLMILSIAELIKYKRFLRDQKKEIA